MTNQIDTNKLKQAEAVSSIVKDMISSAIEQSAANPTLASEALKQASSEVAQVQTLISQAQSLYQTQSSEEY
jgi:ribosomal protein L17